MEIDFIEAKEAFVKQLELLPAYPNDIALRRVIQIMRTIQSIHVFKKEIDLISRISIDSVEDWNTVNMILNFLKRYK